MKKMAVLRKSGAQTETDEKSFEINDNIEVWVHLIHKLIFLKFYPNLTFFINRNAWKQLWVSINRTNYRSLNRNFDVNSVSEFKINKDFISSLILF